MSDECVRNPTLAKYIAEPRLQFIAVLFYGLESIRFIENFESFVGGSNRN